MKLSEDVRGHIRRFVYYYFNGTLGFVAKDAGLLGIDYLDILENHPSTMESVIAIYLNHLETDEDGRVHNHEYALHRTALWVKDACSSGPSATEFKDGETRLH